MSSAKQRAVQVPGEPTKPEPVEADQTQVEQVDGDTVDPEKEALRAQLAELTARLQAAEASKGKKQEAAAPVASVAGGAQKTEHGWIVPDTFGTPVKKG